MANYLDAPLVSIEYLRPTKARFDNPGSSIDGGVNGLGEAISIEMSGGGIITATYEGCVLEGPDERHEIINWLGARGNGGYRFFVVPLINHKNGPFPIINGNRRPTIKGIPHSDGALFSDDAGYSQATVWGEVVEMVNTGVLKIRMFGLERPLRWSDWFSFFHPTKGWRVYRYWKVIGQTVETNPVFTLALSPPLRETVNVGDRVEFAEPKCVMKFPRGFTLPFEYDGWYSARPTLQFTEAF